MLKDTRFILVRAECLYVQFAATARVISTERFVVGGTNGRESDRSQVSDEKYWKGAQSLVAARLCVMRCVVCRIDPSP